MTRTGISWTLAGTFWGTRVTQQQINAFIVLNMNSFTHTLFVVDVFNLRRNIFCSNRVKQRWLRLIHYVFTIRSFVYILLGEKGP